jgi:very-short-patch-repair endonuclease
MQCGVISRSQALNGGLSSHAIGGHLRTGSWQQLQRGVYATFTGQPPREAMLWAALLRSGASAVLSHQTAAELGGLTDRISPTVHVTVPTTQRIRGTANVIIHRSSRIAIARHPVLLPPRTRIEETVIDLTQTAHSSEEAFHWLSRACGSRLTTASRLKVAVEQRKQVRYRNELVSGLAAITDGVQSTLEYRYVRGVERPHELPVARRQAKITMGKARRYLDNLYEDFGVAMELDGHAAHLVHDRWRDIHRDNALTGADIITLRYSWTDVTQRTCEVAAEIGSVLRQRGWTGNLRSCSPRCTAQPGDHDRGHSSALFAEK